MTGIAFSKIGSLPNSWVSCRIYWSDDNKDDFSLEHDKPHLDLSQKTKEDLKDFEQMNAQNISYKNQQEHRDNKNPRPTMKIAEGEEKKLNSLFGSKKVNALVCNVVSQWVVLEIEPGAEYNKDVQETWPTAEMWAFLQPPSIGERGDGDFVIDDAPRIGFFYATLTPDDIKVYLHDEEKTVEQREVLIEHTSVEKKVDKETTKEVSVVRYKVRVDVRNSLNQKDMLKRLRSLKLNYKALTNKDFIEDDWYLGSYMKIWARNYQYEFEDNLADLRKGMDNFDLVESMNQRDPNQIDANNPQKYPNHTWKRDAIIDKNDVLLLVLLMPKISIQILNNQFTPSESRSYDNAKVDIGAVFGVSTLVVVLAGILGLVKKKTGSEKFYKTLRMMIKHGNPYPYLAAYAISGFGDEPLADKAKNANEFPALSNMLTNFYKAIIAGAIGEESGSVGKAVGKVKDGQSTARGNGSTPDTVSANPMKWLTDKLESYSKPDDDGNVGVKKWLAEVKDSLTRDGEGFNIKGDLFQFGKTKMIPPTGIPLLWVLNFNVKFSGGGKAEVALAYKQTEDKKAKKTEHSLELELKGTGTLKLEAALEAIWTTGAELIDDDGLNDTEKAFLEPLKDLLALVAIKAYLSGTLTKTLGAKFTFKFYTGNTAADEDNFDWDPTFSMDIGLNAGIKISILEFDYKFLNGDIYDIKKDHAFFPKELGVSIFGFEKVWKGNKFLFYKSDYVTNLEYTGNYPSKIQFGEKFAFELLTKPGTNKPQNFDKGAGAIEYRHNGRKVATFVDGLKLQLEERPNTKQWALVCYCRFTLDEIKDDKGKTTDKLEKNGVNIISLFEKNDSDNFVNEFDKKGRSFQPYIKEPGKTAKTYFENPETRDEFLIKSPEVNILKVDFPKEAKWSSKIVYDIKIENTKEPWLWVRFKDERLIKNVVVEYKDPVTKNYQEWNQFKVSDFDEKSGVGKLVVELNRFKGFEYGENLELYPQFALYKFNKAVETSQLLFNGVDEKYQAEFEWLG